MSDRSKRRDAEALRVKEAMQEAPSCPEAKSAGMHAGHEHETRWTHRVHLFARSSMTSTPCHFSLNKQIHPVIEIFDELHSPIPQHAGYYLLSCSGYYLIKHW